MSCPLVCRCVPTWISSSAKPIVGRNFVYVADRQREKRGDDGEPKPRARLTRPVLLALPLPAARRARSARVE